MSIGFSCPHTGDNVAVQVQGGQSTICVCGTYSSTLGFFQQLLAVIRALFRWLLRLLGSQPMPTGPQTIRVRVVSGNGTPVPSPTPKQAGDYDFTPPTSPWCCNPITLPSASGGSTQYTAFAWLLNSDGTIADGPQIVTFNVGGAGSTVDCCAGCGSVRPRIAAELAAHPPLEVAVPDGPNAGRHKATAVAHLTWAMVIRGVTYKLACDDGAGLVMRGPSSAEPSSSVERGPFSATFPGAVLGSAGEVVVTQA
jgi:hypothetical protein